MPPPRRPRLGGLTRTGGPRVPRAPPPRKQEAAVKSCPGCGSTEFVVDEGSTICKNCYVQIDEANIVAEVTFEEQQGGRSTVQGGTVADNSRHARTLGAGAYRKVGGGERNSLADIQNAGRRNLEALCPKLGITDNVSMQANQIWTLAANINFSAGRKTNEVISACLYAACRRQTHNDILLMDIAEQQGLNVFRLGEVYRALCKELYLNNESVGHQNLVELEPLIHKYCEKLQFGNKTSTVAEDALRIIRRMNRDWIVSGRHPAGLCGACIILAARMNNFQRSVREVVYVSKVADVTIAKRIAEFRKTRSSGLTVELFREFGNRITTQEDPPSLYASEEQERILGKRRQKREEHMRVLEERATAERESQLRASQPRTVINIPDDATDASSRSPSVEASNRSQTPNPMATPPATQQQQPPAAIMTAQSSPIPAPEVQAAPLTTESLPVPAPETQTAPSPDRQGEKRKSEEDLASAAKRQKTAAPVEKVSGKRKSTEDLNAASKRQKFAHSQEQTPRVDADGFAIPALPAPAPVIDPALEDRDATPKRGRGRPKKSDKPPEIVISQEELAEENYLEMQIQAALENGQVQEQKTEVERAKEEAENEQRILLQQRKARVLAIEQQALDAQSNKERREAAGLDHFGEPTQWNTGEILTAEQLEAEFENDPEVENCLLSETETKIKEQIWVAHNEDWLRKQAEKELLAKVASTTTNRRKSKLKNGKKRKKHSRMGDGSVLTESSTPIETPEDAARAMLEKRAPQKSAHVDFTALQRIYGREIPSRASASPDESSNSQTPADSRQPSATPAPEDEENEADTSEHRPVDEEARVGAAEADEEADDVDADENDFVENEEEEDPWDHVNNAQNRKETPEPELEVDEYGVVYADDEHYSDNEYE